MKYIIIQHKIHTNIYTPYLPPPFIAVKLKIFLRRFKSHWLAVEA
jgi:hypothetical protein